MMNMEKLRTIAYALVEAEMHCAEFRAVLFTSSTDHRVFVQTSSETGDMHSLKEAAETFLRDSAAPDAVAKLDQLRNALLMQVNLSKGPTR